MKSKFNRSFACLLFTALFFIPKVNAQTKTNLEVFYLLTDSLAGMINSEIPSSQNEILLELHSGDVYSVFRNNIKSAFINSGKKVRDLPPDEFNILVVSIVIENASVGYGEVYKDGWFGSHYTTRNFLIEGNYLQTFSEKGKQDFSITFADTIKVDEIINLEKDPFAFTKGEIPSEPFLSGFAEPVIAIGTAAAVVVLFFTVRSK